MNSEGSGKLRNWKINILFFLLTFILVACQSDEVVTFPDKYFENAIRTELDQHGGDLMKSELSEVTELDLEEEEIEDISGIEVFDSLEKINLKHNQIVDVSPLRELDNIEYINLVGNNLDKKQYQRLDFLWKDGVKVITMKEADGPGGFLWKTQKGNTTVYMLGTIHAGPKDFYPMHEKIENAYNEADIVVPEIDITSSSIQGEITKLYMELGAYQDGSSIEDHISDDLYAELKKIFEEYNLPSEMEMYRPWLLSNIIDSLTLQEAGYMYGVDDYFLTKAQEDDKEIKQLETAQEQLSLFADTSDAYQNELLKSSLHNLDTYEEDMLELFSFYSKGDKEALLNYLEPEYDIDSDDTLLLEEDQAFMEKLNDDRNIGMAEQIENYLEEDDDHTYFVIVGTAHLIMEPSVLSILGENGYDIEKIH